MSKKAEQSRLEQLVRRQGAPQTPKVDPLESEVGRASSRHPRPVKGDQEGVLGGIEMSSSLLPLAATFRVMSSCVRTKTITDSLNKRRPARGTSVRTCLRARQSHYRTVWA